VRVITQGTARYELVLWGSYKNPTCKSSCAIVKPHDDFRKSQRHRLFPEEISVPIIVKVSNSERASSGVERVNRDGGNFMRTTELDFNAWLPVCTIEGQGIDDTVAIEVCQNRRRVRLELRDRRGNNFFMLRRGRRTYIHNRNGDHQKEYLKAALPKSSSHTSDYISDMDC
jgi:hypothetical protein